MKRGAFQLTSCILLLNLVACDKAKKALDNLLSFSIQKAIPQQEVPGSLAPCQVINALDIPIANLNDVKISKEEDFPEQNTDVRLIQSAKLESLTLALTEASSQKNWDWLESITVHIEASGLPRQKLASMPTVANGLTVLNLAVENIDIASQIKASGGFTLSSEVAGCPPPSNVVFQGVYKVFVKASPL